MQTAPAAVQPTMAQMADMLKAMQAENARVAAENAKLAAQLKSATSNTRNSIKIGGKGYVSVQHSTKGAWPCSLTRPQWLRVLDRADEIREFLTANKDALDAFAHE